MLLVVFGDIYIDDLQNIFPDVTMDITKCNDKFIRKAIKNYLEMTSKNLNFWLGVYKIHNK
jgi:hypothetical protein